MVSSYNQDLSSYVKRFMYKSGLTQVKPDLLPDPEALLTPEQKVPNTQKLRRLMHLAKKAEEIG